eukprot:3071784-Ditylum_brightwellii.AAC.1
MLWPCALNAAESHFNQYDVYDEGISPKEKFTNWIYSQMGFKIMLGYICWAILCTCWQCASDPEPKNWARDGTITPLWSSLVTSNYVAP